MQRLVRIMPDMKRSWSPDNITENHIDHVCSSRIFKGSLQDLTVMRRPDVYTDHYLIVATVKLKLKKIGQDRRLKESDLTLDC